MSCSVLRVGSVVEQTLTGDGSVGDETVAGASVGSGSSVESSVGGTPTPHGTKPDVPDPASTLPGFVPYETIPNNVGKVVKALTKPRCAQQTLIVATPKVHGTNVNVTVYQDGVDGPLRILYGKRTAYLHPHEAHFECRQVLDTEPMRRKYAALLGRFPKGSVVRLYGELFGGRYAGLPSSGGSVGPGSGPPAPVQVEVQYDPDLRAVFFDLSVDGKYLPFFDAQLVCRLTRLPFVPVLAKDTTILGLLQRIEQTVDHLWVPRPKLIATVPLIPGNTGEGYVVRTDAPARMLLKVKAPKFLETVADNPRTDRVSSALAAASAPKYITTGRIASVMSKHHIDFGDDKDPSGFRHLPVLVAALEADVVAEAGPLADVGPFRRAAFAALKAYLVERARFIAAT